MGEPVRIRVEDPETGDIERVDVPVGDYFILCTEPCHVAHIQTFRNGTHVLTIKGRSPSRPTEGPER